MAQRSFAHLDRVNTVLILVSALCALRWPFETLLLAYAVLGPLHYLTEISWLHDRNYFLPHRRDAFPLLLGGALLLVATATSVSALDPHSLRRAIENGALFALFGFALILVLTPRWSQRLLALAVLAPLCLWFAWASPIAESVAGYLPTVFHVYLFTGAFLLLGWLRRPQTEGAIVLAAYLISPLLCLLLPVAWSAPPAGWAADAFVGTLSSISAQLLGDAGYRIEREALTTHPSAVAVARVLGFAYLYHYLNWFSKIEVIGWARVSRLRALVILVLWAAAVGVYVYDYLIGFLVLLLLSFLHVILEFPLNHRSFREIGQRVRQRRAAPAAS